MKIVLINTLYVEESSLLELKSMLESMGHLFSYYLVKPQNNNDYINRIKNADVLIVDNTPTPKAVLQEATQLKYIDVAFTGFDHIDIEYCVERGIKVSNASGYSTESVSELTIGLIRFYKIHRGISGKANKIILNLAGSLLPAFIVLFHEQYSLG